MLQNVFVGAWKGRKGIGSGEWPRRTISLAVISLVLATLLTGNGIASGETVAGTVVVQDTFSRTNSVGWGSANQGGTYKLAPDASGFKVANGSGTFPSIQPGKGASAVLSASTISDPDMQSVFSLPASPTSAFYFAVAARSQADGSQYRGRISVGVGGKANVSFSRTKGSAETYLGSASLPFAVAPAQKVVLRLQVSGTTSVALKIKAWPSGTTEPTWQLSATDSSAARIATAGNPGLWAYVSSGGAASSLNVFAFSANDLAGVTTAPPPTPEPSTPTSLTGAGASTVGSAQYAVPTGALFVATNGSDGAGGSASAPLRNIATAINKAVSGQTIVVRAGSYHETLLMPSTKKLTIQSYPGEAVWLEGTSRLGTWTKSGAVWVASNWATRFDASPTYSRGAPDGTTANWQFVNPAYPMAAHPDQVFINGSAQSQVASVGQVTAGKFFVDYGTQRIYLGSDPTGKDVRASDLVTALTITSAGSTVRGIGIRRYSPSVPDMGAVRVSGKSVTLENVSIEDSATSGLSVYASDVTARKVSVLRSGMLNIHGNVADRFSLDRVRSEYANTENFNMAPVSGGLKLTKSRVVTIKGSVFSNNRGPGLWFDQSVYDMKILSSNVQYNASHGIQMEISAKFVVADCLVTNNAKIGIFPRNTNNGRIWNNTTIANGESNINVLQDTRRPTNTSYGQDNRQPFPDPTMTWLITTIEIKNNINAKPSSSATAGLFLRDQSGRSAEAMGPDIDGNFHNRVNAGTPKNIIGWTRFGSPIYYSTFAAFRSATSQDAHGLSIDGSDAMTPAGTLTASAAAATANVPRALPSDVAGLIGQPAGISHLGAWR